MVENQSKFMNYNDFSSNNGMPNLMNNPMGMNMMNMNNHSRLKSQAANVLFVADLPDETCEEDLMGLFKDYKYKVSRVTNSVNRTYALVHFESAEFAEKARNDLNGVKISAKYSNISIQKPIRLCRWETKTAINDRREDDYKKNLLVKNLNKDVSAHYLWNMFKQIGDVRSSKLAVDYAGNSKGFGYITYYKVADSEKARNELNNKIVNGKEITIDFLQPGLKKKIKKNNIYVKKFPKENFTDKELRGLFEPFGELVSVLVAPDSTDPTKNRGFGFVCFKNADDAEKAQMNLNNKTIWENQPALYVSYAMKKEERLEHFQKKKEELLRNSSRMTVFCKIKEGFNFNSEIELNKEIMKFLAMCFGENYNPRSLKSRVDSKNAFITLNSVHEVEQFINFYSDFSKSQPVSLYFNPYKSKIERINASNLMKKKYNNFNNDTNIHQVEPSPRHDFYKAYNDFSSHNQFMMMNPNQAMGNPMMMQNYMMMQQQQQQQYGMKNYNNFNDMNANMNNMNLNQVQNPNVNVNMQAPQQQNKTKEELESEEKEALLDNIYEFITNIYPNEASKITGMISELSIQEIKEYTKDQAKLEGIAKTAYNQLIK